MGKSNFVVAIISGTIAESALDSERTLGLTIIPNPSGRAVILFDTEQSEHQLYKNVHKAIKRAYLDDKPDFFMPIISRSSLARSGWTSSAHLST